MKTKNQKVKKIQKREIIIKEYEDGTFDMECPLFWKLEKIPKKEINEICLAWVNGDIKEKSAFKIEPPKSIKI